MNNPTRRIWQVDTAIIKARSRAELDAEINAILERTGINPWTNEPMWEPVSVTGRPPKFWVTFRRLVPE